MTMIAVTYGYARVSKTDEESKNLDTQLLVLAEHGIQSDLVHSDVASGRDLQRTGWQELLSRVQGGDTIVVAFLDRLNRNFENSVRIQAKLTRRNIGIVAIRENIDTRRGAPRPNSSGGRCWPRGPTKWIPPASGFVWIWIGPGLAACPSNNLQSEYCCNIPMYLQVSMQGEAISALLTYISRISLQHSISRTDC